MNDDHTSRLLDEIQRELEDTTQEISQAVEKLEAGQTTDSEALLGEAAARLKLLVQRVEERRSGLG